MARTDDKPVITTSITWPGVLVVILAGLYPAAHEVYWAIPLTMAAVAAGIGVWRAVRLLGMILDHMHWRDVQVPAEDD